MKKNMYETIIIFDSTNHDISVGIFRDMCQEFTGSEYIIHEDLVGVKKLAYPIKEKTEGYYVIYTWLGLPENVAELERCLRINDNVLKFMTIRKRDEDVDEEDSDEDYLRDEFITSQGLTKSEQAADAGVDNPNSKIDALDVMLGFADYVKVS